MRHCAFLPHARRELAAVASWISASSLANCILLRSINPSHDVCEARTGYILKAVYYPCHQQRYLEQKEYIATRSRPCLRVRHKGCFVVCLHPAKDTQFETTLPQEKCLHVAHIKLLERRGRTALHSCLSTIGGQHRTTLQRRILQGWYAVAVVQMVSVYPQT